MSKAVLVIDMPSKCAECNFHKYGICHAVSKSIVGTPTDLNYKPEWCPLRELPEYKEEKHTSDYSDIKNEGYNACIDEILGD